VISAPAASSRLAYVWRIIEPEVRQAGALADPMIRALLDFG